MRLRRIVLPVLTLGIAMTLIPGFVFSESSASDSLERYRKQKPTWQRCDPKRTAKFQCAQIEVPLDYKRPDRQRIKVAISRLKSPKPKERHGVMLLNPGGPGGPGLDMPLERDGVPKSVTDKYDLIGFDPRGVGKSTPVTCKLTEAETEMLRPYKPKTFAKDVDRARTVASKCRKAMGKKFLHITTRNTARDMDIIRSVLGESRISYDGTSYGTYLGAVYTQMFPDRADRFVLDSGVDPARIWRGMIQAWAIDAESAFTRWTKWTAARDNKYHLGDTPAEVRKAFWDVVAAADHEPIAYDGEKLTGEDVQQGHDSYRLKPAAERISALKQAVDDRTSGPSAGPAESNGTASRDDSPAKERAAADGVPKDNGTAALWAVLCTDTRGWSHDPERYRREAIRDKATYPLSGGATSNITPCAFWDRVPEPATKVDNDVPVLTVQNQYDSQTPLFTGRGLHRALDGSRMVYVKGGEGHGVYPKTPKACADRAINTYLTTGRLPSKDVTCKPADDAPAPASARNRSTPFPDARF